MRLIEGGGRAIFSPFGVILYSLGPSQGPLGSLWGHLGATSKTPDTCSDGRGGWAQDSEGEGCDAWEALQVKEGAVVIKVFDNACKKG